MDLELNMKIVKTKNYMYTQYLSINNTISNKTIIIDNIELNMKVVKTKN